MISIDTESRREIASRHSSDSDSSASITGTGVAASEPREIKLHSTAREIGVGLEPVAAAPAIVGGSLCNLVPSFCLPGKGAPSHGQPDHDGCNDP
jgi:hypothetical protein